MFSSIYIFYSVHASCTNALGQSRSSKNVEELQTLGQVPEAPSNPMDFVHPSNTSVRLDLFMWNKQTCPVEYFIVSYRREKVCTYICELIDRYLITTSGQIWASWYKKFIVWRTRRAGHTNSFFADVRRKRAGSFVFWAFSEWRHNRLSIFTRFQYFL